jgi:ribonuclease BN (tRNA processing enzyme)
MASSSDRRPQARLRCFGVGDGWPGSDRRHASFHYQFGNTQLVLDCGDGLSAGFTAAGLGVSDVDHLLISHMHSDHVGGLSLFIQGLWLGKRKRPLHLHAPERAILALQAWLEATLLPPALIGFPIEWHPLVPARPFRCGQCTVTAFPTTHLEGLRRRFAGETPLTCFDAFAFLIEFGTRRIAHSADIGQVRDLEPLLAGPLDLLVCELSHVSPEELLRRLQAASLRKVVWIHLAQGWWNSKSRVKATIQAALGAGRARIARDGDVIPI